MQQERGFTIVEVLIALLLFAILLITGAFVRLLIYLDALPDSY